MTGPRIDPLDQLFGKEDPLDSLFPAEKEEKKKNKYPLGGYSALADLGKGMVSGAKRGLQNTADAALLGIGGLSAIPSIAARRATRPEDEESNSGFESAGRFAGRMVSEAPLFMGVQGAVGATAIGAKALGKSATTFLGRTASAIPENVVSGLIGTAATDPASVQTPSGLAVNTALAAGFSILSGFKGRIKAATTLDDLRAIKAEVEAAPPIELPPEIFKVTRDPRVPKSVFAEPGKLPTALEAVQEKFRSENELRLILADDLDKQYKLLMGDKPDIKIVSSFGPKKTNFDNPVTLGNLDQPGSGVQSPHPYVPSSIPSDPLAQASTTKFTNTPLAGLDANEAEVAKIRDFGNVETQAARLNQNYLLDTRAKQQKYLKLDYLEPIKQVSPVADDIAGKLLRIPIRMRENVTHRLSIPTRDGGYTDGPMSLPTWIRESGGGAENMKHATIYADARQIVAGEAVSVDVPLERAQEVVDSYATKYPQIVAAYENSFVPLMKGIVQMTRGYHNLPYTDAHLDILDEKQAYASLSRAINQPNGMGMMKARGEVSKKLVGDLVGNTQENIRSITQNGEKAKLVAELAQTAIDNPGKFDGIIDIIPHEPPPGLQSVIDQLDPKLPELTRRALAEALITPPVGHNKFNIRLDSGNPVTVRLAPEVTNSLDFLNRGTSTFKFPENMQKWEKFLGSPVAIARGAAKFSSLTYSIFRDLYKGTGQFYDLIEAQLNSITKGPNPLKDPVAFMKSLGKDLVSPARGLYHQMTDSEIMHHLHAAGAGKSFYGADSDADAAAKSLDELMKLGSMSKSQFRLAHPIKTLEKFAGDIANAVTAGQAIRALENGASYSEAASVYNNILGDPFRVGAQLATFARLTPFLKYPIQATRRTIQNFTKSPSHAAIVVARAATTLSTVAAANWYLRKDDEEVTKASQDPVGERFMLSRDPFNPDEILATRMPFLFGALFMKPVTSTLDAMYGNISTKEAAEQIGMAALKELVPNVIPLSVNAVVPLVTGQRVDLFQGSQPVVPASKRNLLPQDQDDGTASVAAKRIAEFTSIPSGAVENVFRSFLVGDLYTGYKLANDYNDDYKGPKTFNSFYFLPGVKRTEVPKAGIKNVNEFYNEVGKAQRMLMSLERAQKVQPQHYRELWEKHRPEYSNAQMLVSYKRDMDQISAQINEAKLNESWDPERKKHEIDRYVATRIMIATRAMEKLRNRR